MRKLARETPRGSRRSQGRAQSTKAVTEAPADVRISRCKAASSIGVADPGTTVLEKVVQRSSAVRQTAVSTRLTRATTAVGHVPRASVVDMARAASVPFSTVEWLQEVWAARRVASVAQHRAASTSQLGMQSTAAKSVPKAKVAMARIAKR